MQRIFEKNYIMDENDSLSEYIKIPLGHNRTNVAVYSKINFKVEIYIEFIEINKHKKKLQIYIQQLMAAHIIVDNGYLKIE